MNTEILLFNRNHEESMTKQTKQIRKAIFSWVSIAHERELRAALDMLAKDFERWKASEITSFDLSDLIHKFQKGPAREIWKKYNDIDPDLALGGAISRGIIDKAELPDEVLEALSHILDFLDEVS